MTVSPPVSGAARWHRPNWQLAMLLAGLSMIGPFSIDTYLPAFAGIAEGIGASAIGMQQTLSAYLFGFAFMSLFHGALSDSFGRKRIILTGLAVFTVGSIGATLAGNLTVMLIARTLQGMSAGAGLIVGRAVMRDLFAEVDAQKMMSLTVVFFGVAPAVAPMIGGYLFTHLGWPSIFLFLVVAGITMFFAVMRLLPETLAPESRQPFSAASLLKGYREVGFDIRFLLLSLASGVPFNGFFLYIVSTPVFLGDLLHLQPHQFWWFFMSTVSGIVIGSAVSGRLAGRLAGDVQVRAGFTIMLLACAANMATSWWQLGFLPVVFAPILIYAFGWALVMPSVTLRVLNLFPARRGMASSLQGFVSSVTNGLVAGVLAPLVMHSRMALAIASIAMFAVGIVAWVGYRYSEKK